MSEAAAASADLTPAAFKPADYKTDLKPVWCAGCGDFGVLTGLYRALTELQVKPWETVVVSGIGCSSRLPGYVDTFGVNSLHGRALPLAAGVKVARPGVKGGIYQTNGLEHDEEGSPGSGFLLHEKMNAKRYRKLRPIRDNHTFHRRYGSEQADIGILCWGSSKGAVREAVRRANARGQKVAAFVPQMIYPFPKKEFEAFLNSVKRVLVVELSYSAQFYKYLRTFLDLPADRTHVYKRSGGKNLTVAEVDAEIVGLFAAERAQEKVSA